jgi:3-phytase
VSGKNLFGCLALLSGLALLSTAHAASRGPTNVISVTAGGETVPVPHNDDAADDPAIWIHPTAPELSLILGTDKKGGLQIYNLDGSEREVVARESHPNNVDVLYDFGLHGGTVDLAVMTTRGEHSRGIEIWAIDPSTREFENVTKGDTITAFPNDEPYGCCTYRGRTSGVAYVFVTAKSGAIEQYALATTRDGRVTMQKVSAMKLRSTVEACVADEELGVVYFGEETRGIWKTTAEPSTNRVLTLITKTGQNGLRADVEGLAIYVGTNGSGYLIASSQGNDTFKVYERGGTNRFVTTINPVAGKFGDVEETDGIAVTSRALPPLFPHGLLVIQDGKNSRTNQNFKLFAWEDIAGTNLLNMSGESPRK